MEGRKKYFYAMPIIAVILLVATGISQPRVSYPDHIRKGIEFYNKGDIDRAEAEFNSALKLNDDSATAHYFLAGALADKGDLESALDEYSRAVELRPEWQWARLRYAMTAMLLAKYDLAEQQYIEILKRDPGRADAETMLGYMYSSIFDYKKAVPLLADLQRRFPSDLLIAMQLAQMYRFMGGHDKEAIAIMEGIIKQHPDATLEYYYLAKDYISMDNFRETERVLLSMPHKESFPRVWWELSRVYFLTGEFDKALEMLDKAAEYSPNWVPIYKNMANIHLEMGNTAEARKALMKIKEISPENSFWASGMGKVCELEGDRECAAEYFEKALTLSPDSERDLESLHDVEPMPDRNGGDK